LTLSNWSWRGYDISGEATLPTQGERKAVGGGADDLFDVGVAVVTVAVEGVPSSCVMMLVPAATDGVSEF
jgi:hypothetical protein